MACWAATNPSTTAFMLASPQQMSRGAITTTTTKTTSQLFSVVESATTAGMAEAGIPPSTAEPSMEMADEMSVPTNLPSECGMDYIPLATMLATGQLAEADQVSICCCSICLSWSHVVNGHQFYQLLARLPVVWLHKSTMMSSCPHRFFFFLILIFVVVHSRCLDPDFGCQVEEQRFRLFYRCQEYPSHRLGND